MAKLGPTSIALIVCLSLVLQCVSKKLKGEKMSKDDFRMIIYILDEPEWKNTITKNHIPAIKCFIKGKLFNTSKKIWYSKFTYVSEEGQLCKLHIGNKKKLIKSPPNSCEEEQNAEKKCKISLTQTSEETTISPAGTTRPPTVIVQPTKLINTTNGPVKTTIKP